MKYVLNYFGNHLIMINTANKLNLYKRTLKQKCNLKLKPLKALETVHIFAMPTKIQDKDITAMFKGVLNLMREKIQQEQTEKFLTLKLKYDRLKYLYDKARQGN